MWVSRLSLIHICPGIFWGVELGALASLAVLLWLFRRETQPIAAKVETEVEDDVPTALMLLTVGLLIAASFLPEPAAGPRHTVYEPVSYTHLAWRLRSSACWL